MKRLLAAATCVGVGFVLGIACLGTALKVGAVSVPTATQNGDTNGDGERDISDAVYLLQFLFSGGADIAQIECPQCPTRSGLVATGQSTCYGSVGFIECTIDKARGQDGFYSFGCPLDGRFVDNGDGTVSDACTGLMWTRTRVDVDGDGEITSLDAKPWLEACQIAHDMTYLGHDDWRVPNVNELLSIVNIGGADVSLAAVTYDLFRLEGSIESGTWTSTTSGGSQAFSYLLSSGGGSCECCPVTKVDVKGAHPFIAVRSQ